MKAILVPVSEFCRLIGVRRTTAFSLIKEGRVESVKLGAKRLVTLASIEHLVEQSLGAVDASGEPAKKAVF